MPMGRPTRLTDDVQERIVTAVNAGNYVEVAAQYAGVATATYHEWMARGRAAIAREDRDEDEPEPCPTCGAEPGDPCITKSGREADHPHRDRIDRPVTTREDDARYAEFAREVEKARASAEVRALTNIQRAAMDGTWQASAWYLERSYPHRWGRRALEVTGRDGGPVEVASVEALNERLEELLADDD